jgi:hypothetical protein
MVQILRGPEDPKRTLRLEEIDEGIAIGSSLASAPLMYFLMGEAAWLMQIVLRGGVRILGELETMRQLWARVQEREQSEAWKADPAAAAAVEQPERHQVPTSGN